MKNLVVFGALGAPPAGAPGLPAVTVDGVTVRCGMVPAAEPRFDPDAPENGRRVLVRVRALSCNYRDRGFIFSMRGVPAARYSTLGSEFAGEVVAVGAAVEAFRPGDRVLPDMEFTGTVQRPEGFREGVATNQASRAHLVLHERKLRRIPDTVPDEVAATFALNAQTAYSMVRRLDLSPGENVLVTSGGSNTSLYAIGALAARGVNVFAATTSPRAAERLRGMGLAGVLTCARADGGFAGSDEPLRFAAAAGGFDAVVDPFFDLHLQRAVQLMRPFGRYVTCGLAGQNDGSAASGGTAGPDALTVFHHAMRSNLTLIGNCIGRSDDLRLALDDLAAGRLAAHVDSVWGGDDVRPFLERTFNDPARFGKVAFRYA